MWNLGWVPAPGKHSPSGKMIWPGVCPPTAVHLEKRRIEGNDETKIVLRGIIAPITENTVTLPGEKIDRAEEFLMLPAFDPCVTRIPPRRLQELRGRVEHWSNCNTSLGPEMRFIDRLLAFRSGVTSPKGSSREIKQEYIDFRTCLETIRAHMATDTYWSQSYTTGFTGALSLDEQLSRPGAKDRSVWVGSDATSIQCAGVD